METRSARILMPRVVASETRASRMVRRWLKCGSSGSLVLPQQLQPSEQHGVG